MWVRDFFEAFKCNLLQACRLLDTNSHPCAEESVSEAAYSIQFSYFLHWFK